MELAALVVSREEDGGCVVDIGCAGWRVIDYVIVGFCFGGEEGCIGFDVEFSSCSPVG